MSFASELKESLTAHTIKKKCCQRVFSEIMELDKAAPGDRTDFLRSVHDKCKCPFCFAHCLRGLFIKFGSITDPEKQYHLDFTFRHEAERDFVAELLTEGGFDPKCSVRRDKYVAYFKGSSAIEDFLVYIGASSVAFELMNQKIVKELRNNVNRQINCDTANIEKILKSSKKYLDAIDYLIDSGELGSLPQNLRETALLKRSNPQIPLEQLGQMLIPSVSKSGMKHRLEKIYLYYTEKTETPVNTVNDT